MSIAQMMVKCVSCGYPIPGDRVSCANCGAAVPLSEENICCTDQNKLFNNIRRSWEARRLLDNLYSNSLEVGKIIVNKGVAEIHFDELNKFLEFAFNWTQRDCWEKKSEVRLFMLKSEKLDRFIALVDNVVAVLDVSEKASPIIQDWERREEKRYEEERKEREEARLRKEAEEQQRCLKLKEEECANQAAIEAKRVDYESKMKSWQSLPWYTRRKTPKPVLD